MQAWLKDGARKDNVWKDQGILKGKKLRGSGKKLGRGRGASSLMGEATGKFHSFYPAGLLKEMRVQVESRIY